MTTAFVLCSGVLLAQTDPSTGQPATSQSGLQQQNPSSATHAASASQESSSGPSGNAETMKDRIFLRKAAEGGMAEIQFGQLASQKAGSDDVKSFAQKMVTDHTELNSEMKPFAESLGVHTPKKLNSKDQAEYDKLNGLSGDEFDREYLACMLKDHHEDLREFRKESENTPDPSLKAAVDKGEVVILQHTHMVTVLAKSKGVPVPGRGGMAAAGTTP